MVLSAQTHGDLEARVREKLARVLGAYRAQQLFHPTLAEAKLEGLHGADDLLAFARVLAGRAGFEGTVGALLRVEAVMMGARDE